MQGYDLLVCPLNISPGCVRFQERLPSIGNLIKNSKEVGIELALRDFVEAAVVAT